MTFFHFKKLLKYPLLILIIYNLFTLTLLFAPSNSLKYNFWHFMPYDYSQGMKYPNNLNSNSLLNNENRNLLFLFFKKNINKNLLNINFWNKKLIIDSYLKNENNEFEISFINLFILTKNNQNKRTDLKKYFINNYKFFSEKNKNLILKLY